jgi:glycosyltransferase involved in cell wall biosynthesis
MKKPVILFYTRPIVPPWDEASKNLAFDIANNLSKKFQANLLGTKKDPFNKRITTQKSNLKIEEIYRSANLNFWGRIKLLKRLYRFKLKVDLIHFLFTPRSLTSLLIKARLKFSKVKTVQTVATLDNKIYQKPKKLKKVLLANKIVVQSKNTLNKLKKVGFENVELIYPGIDLKKYKPTTKDTKLIKDLKIKTGDFIILYTGEYTRLKAIDDILEALKILNQSPENKNLKLILACRIKNKKDAKKKKQVIDWIKKENLQSNVVFLDTFSEMNKLYNISDLNIFPAREMAGKFDIPLTLVESMACKKPVIVSKLKNLKELVGKNSYGLVVKTKKPQDLAEKIELLKRNKKLYNKLALNAFNFVKENFDIKKNIKKYEVIYEELTFKK